MSLPSASGCMPAASAAAAPPDEPPAVRERSYGLRVTPNTSLKVWPPAANSGMLVLPMVTAPAALIRSTARSSPSGTKSDLAREPNVVLIPAVRWLSLCAMGSALQGTREFAAGRQVVEFGSALRRPLRRQRDDGVDRRVHRVDPLEMGRQHLRALTCFARSQVASRVAGR